ncbi:MAG: amidohydrolase family protein [Gammaproteobacteria bacterium]|nr:amidohydrolase family protein [Gammaproteobacteria bacterium]
MHNSDETGPLRVVLVALALTLAPQASAQEALARAPYLPDSGTLAVRCGSLIDGLAEEAQADRWVLIRDGRVSEVQPGTARIRGYDRQLDLSGYTCLPGLIDTHTHITDQANETRDLSIYYTRSVEEERRISRRNAEVTLFAGFTTVRNVGAYGGWSGRDIRDRINAGEVAGPRVQTAGFYLTIPGGGGDLVIPGRDESEIPARVRLGVALGPDEFRRKAEEAVAGGADVLKVIASGAVLAYGGIPGAPEMTPEEIAAVVEVGHAAGIKVTAHAHGARSIREAILAGADSIEHASLADDEAIALAAERGVAFSMDVYNGDYIASVGRAQGWPEEFLRKNDETVDEQRTVFQKAHAAGVRISYGTDAAVYPHGDNALQFPVMVRLGMTPMEAIKAATSVSAEVIGWQDRVGAIHTGRYGDLIAVAGDPLADITLLQRVPVIIKGGLVFKAPADRVR